MTPTPTCCTPEDTTVRIANMMKTADVGSVPVCEGQTKTLVGIITDRDLALQVVAAGKHPQQVTARDVMTRDPVTCRADDDVQAALDAMEKHKIRRLPITDNARQLLGIITQADVATRIDAPKKTAELLEAVSKPSNMRAR